MVYSSQELFKKELECVQQQQIIVPVMVDEMSEWYNSFALVHKPIGSVCLCLDSVRLNQALINWCTGAQLSMIHSQDNKSMLLTVIDSSSGCHKLKLDKI